MSAAALRQLTRGLADKRVDEDPKGRSTMEIRGIDHIEMYVGDARQAAFYFGTAVGFELRGMGGPETGLT
ncbi:MAG: hypothetical protein ACRDTQ_14035, partial [Micromonosporaceae bacterium]